MRRLHPSRLTDIDIEADLLPADRIYQRWARSVGCGLPEEAWDGVQSRPTELPTDAAIWVDRYVCTRADRMRKFIHSWYRGQDASAVIANRFNVGRDAVYMLWRDYLAISREDFAKARCLAHLMSARILVEGAGQI